MIKKTNNPIISVIIPSYNSEKFIKRTINSVLNQTFQDFELIIVDDFSIDNTVKIIKKFQKKDKRIKLIRLKKNSGGPAYPKNVGINKSKGQYIAFLDHDDEWLPEKLEKQLKLFQNSNKNLGLVACNAFKVCVSENNKIRKVQILNRRKRKNISLDILSNNFIFSCSSVMVKKKVFKKVGFFDNRLQIRDDWDLWIRILDKFNFGIVSEPLFKYYIHGDNLCFSSPLKKIKNDFYFLFKKHIKKYQKYPFVHAKMIRHLGSKEMINGNISEARSNFKKAIMIYPYCFQNYLCFLLSFLGQRMYLKLLSFKKEHF